MAAVPLASHQNNKEATPATRRLRALHTLVAERTPPTPTVKEDDRVLGSLAFTPMFRSETRLET